MDYNPNAKVYIGDNIHNHIELSWGGCGDGCNDKATCEDVGFHIVGEDNEEVPSETVDNDLDDCVEEGEWYVNETIVITDPCYIKKSRPEMKTSTLYGDWSCMVYPGEMGVNKDPDEWDEKYFKFYGEYNFESKTEEEKEKMRTDWKCFKERWKKEHILGEFCADAGEVGVFQWSKLTEEDKDWVREHDWCAAVIPNVTGKICFETVTDENGDKSRHVVCKGETNFFTRQSGF